MLESKLSKQVYVFEKCFHQMVGQLKNIEKDLNLKVELTVDFIENKFYLDFNQPFNTETGLLILYGGNLIGNVKDKAIASSEFYKWLGEICEFADIKLNDDDSLDANK